MKYFDADRIPWSVGQKNVFKRHISSSSSNRRTMIHRGHHPTYNFEICRGRCTGKHYHLSMPLMNNFVWEDYCDNIRRLQDREDDASSKRDRVSSYSGVRVRLMHRSNNRSVRRSAPSKNDRRVMTNELFKLQGKNSMSGDAL
jgi:hypothetical protein